MGLTVLLGGSFDPPHLGHLELARAALREPDVDQVLLMPAFQPPHKADRLRDNASQRIVLCRLLTAMQDGLGVETAEINREMRYTADTLRYLRSLSPEREFALLLGGDALRSLPWWFDADYIRETTAILAAARAGEPMSLLPGVRILAAQIPCVSSSEIRKRLLLGEPVHGMLSPDVEQYIWQHHLYEEAQV